MKITKRSVVMDYGVCENCEGTGLVTEKDLNCKVCSGSGHVALPVFCPTCEDEGFENIEELAKHLARVHLVTVLKENSGRLPWVM